MGLFDIFKVKQYKAELEQLKAKMDVLGFTTYEETKAATDELSQKCEALRQEYETVSNEVAELNASKQKAEKQVKSAIAKTAKAKELYKAMEYSIDSFLELDPDLLRLKLPPTDRSDLDEISPSVILKLHHMDVKALKKAFRDNDKQIEKVLKQYQGRYTTKANRTIYDLMVIALRAELQNILFNLKYGKLENAEKQVKEMTKKYLDLATAGNQSIAGTLVRFIGEIEYLFINAVKIEYNYYVKREQAKQEQASIREQMRQEAEEHKALEQEKKKVEKEEQKFKNEIDKVKAQIETASDSEKAALNAKILELESKLADVAVKRESIAQLQNGKAGNVYVISNLGSFGDNVFKIGMTRRLNPLDRINELGSASVPFKFDVHSFIFSEDAVGLETKLHQILNDKRVNKVNLRKEFFYSSVDELEQLVQQIDPTAEFNKTMIAEEFKQSQSSSEVYTSELSEDDFSEDDE